jgi:phospholipid/cholesterol/gamma-HCH transport system substrate-binding protein
MARISDEVKIGIMAVVAILIFIYGLAYLKNYSIRERGYIVTAVYDRVTGLNTGDPVTIAGLNVGRVNKMRLAGTKIAVDLWLRKKTQIPKDSRCVIKGVGVLGEKYVSIIPGLSKEFVSPGDILIGSYETDITEISPDVNTILAYVQNIFERIQNTFGERERLQIQSSLENISKVSDDLTVLTAEIRQRINRESENVSGIVRDLGTFANNLENTSIQLQNITQNKAPDLENIISKTQVVINKLQIASEDLERSSKGLNSIIERVEKGQGTMGKLIYEDELYISLNKVITNLDTASMNANKMFEEIRKLILEFKENPKKFFSPSIF